MADATSRRSLGPEFRAKALGSVFVYVCSLVALFLVSRNSGWQGSTDLHTLVEAMATLLAAIVGMSALIRFRSRRNVQFLLIGMSFIGTALLDGYHTIVTSQWIEAIWTSPPSQVGPSSWSASRLFLPLMILLSWWFWQDDRTAGDGEARQFNKWTVYGLPCGLALSCFGLFTFMSLSPTYSSGFSLGRTGDLVSAGLFLAGLIGYLVKGHWRSDPVVYWLVVSLGLGLVGQAAFMPLSSGLFDAMFDSAHLLKTASYACVLVGLLHGFAVLLRSEEDARAVFEVTFSGAPDGMIVVDQSGNIENANPAAGRIFGCGADGLIGRSVDQLVPEGAVGEHAVPVSEFFNSETGSFSHQSVETRALGADGHEIPVDVHVNRIKTSAGARTFAYIVDLRSAKRAESRILEQNEALIRSNRELDDFAYVVSHDLKEPLRGIRSYAGFLLEDHGESLDQEGRKMLEALPRLAGRLEGLLDSLLHYSRVGRTELAVGPTDLQRLVEEVVDSIHVSLEHAGVEIRIPEPLPSVTGDPVRIAEVFRNLLTNAMKYNDKEEKWIEIGSQLVSGEESEGDSEPELAFYVRDNGIGIREKHIDSVFRIFKRLHRRDAFGGGTGAGLTIVKKLVERHGGRIWVESCFGEGTTFYFTLAGSDQIPIEEKEPEA